VSKCDDQQQVGGGRTTVPEGVRLAAGAEDGAAGEGIKKANAQAEETLALAKKAMGLEFVNRTLH
jgi:hypothetical protein